MATPFANPERQFRARRDTSPTPIHNIYTFYETESSESESKDIEEIDIETLTLEHYLNLNNIPSEALKSIQELADHSHKWHNVERENNTPTPFGIITVKLKALNHEMDTLRVDKESCKRQDVLNELMKKFMINTEMNLKYHGSLIKRLEENVNHLAQLISTHNLTNQECAIKLKPASEKPTLKVETFAEKELSMVKLNAQCSAILQNELPPKEKDLGSFILPCTIGTTTVSNALADLGASINIMPFFLFKRLGLRNPKPINMVIEMADRSMQSPKGIIENVIDVVEINEFDEPRNLEDFLLSNDINGDLGSFLKDNDLLSDLENQDTMSLSPLGSARLNNDSSGMFCNPNSNSSISLDDFIEMDDIWDNLDFRDLTNEATNSPSPFNIVSRKAYNSIMKHELVYTGNNMVGFARNLHVFIGGRQFLTDFIILENINEFMEKGLIEVLFRQPFKEHVGIVEDRVKGVIWFKIGDDKTIFNMPRAEERFGKLTAKQHNTMGPLLKISDEDKTRRIHHSYQKINEFYQGCLELGEEYKHDQEVIDWIKKGHTM
ncbi:homeodomain-like protein [Tanacetum coccineum]